MHAYGVTALSGQTDVRVWWWCVRVTGSPFDNESTWTCLHVLHYSSTAVRIFCFMCKVLKVLPTNYLDHITIINSTAVEEPKLAFVYIIRVYKINRGKVYSYLLRKNKGTWKIAQHNVLTAAAVGTIIPCKKTKWRLLSIFRKKSPHSPQGGVGRDIAQR